jgi:hypothetical protein
LLALYFRAIVLLNVGGAEAEFGEGGSGNSAEAVNCSKNQEKHDCGDEK